ncbi:MAG: carboxypeptidase regulatory-like domain-containing protein [Candidatus Hydrogenedentales bacterium]|jgi:protocatechuate 3,4-dioxygenase beta subunit
MSEKQAKAAILDLPAFERFEAETNAQGIARIDTLLPGNQSFSVTHDLYELPFLAQSNQRSATVSLKSGETARERTTVFPKGSTAPTNPPGAILPTKPAAPEVAAKSPAVDANAPRGTFSGMVTDESGKPLEDVLVDAWTWYSGNETKTDAQGRFTLSGFDDQTDAIEVRFSKDLYCPVLIAEQPVAALAQPIVLGNKTYFEGRVTGPDGAAVVGAQVRANQGPKQGPGVYITEIWTETVSGPDGRYRLFVQDDTYDIQVRDERGNAARLTQEAIAADEAKTLDIRLEPGVVFRATIVDSESGKPVENVRLWNWQHKGLEGRTDAKGEVTIAGMFPGAFEFQIEADGYARWWSEQCQSKFNRPMIDDEKTGWQRNFDSLDFDLQPGMEPVTITLERGVRVRGRIVDPDGKPVAGATAAPARTGSGNSLTGDTRFSVKTKEDGSFDMLLPASKKTQYNLVAHDGDYEEWRTWANGVGEPFSTKPGDDLDGVTLQLTRPGTVRGVAVDEAGNPVTRREVRASAFDKRENRYYDPTTTTDDKGVFELRFVRPGEQYIQVAPFWLSADEAPEGTSQTVTVKPGETIEGIKLVVESPKQDAPVPSPSAEAPPSSQDWREAFDAVYRLNDGEIVRRVPPPFIPERLEYYRFTDRSQAEAIPSGPDFFHFRWDGELKKWGCGFGFENGLSLVGIVGNLGVNRYEIEGEQELLDLCVPGDWIMRLDSPIESRLKALESIVAEGAGRKIHFERKAVEREVVVVRGSYSFHSETSAHNPDAINIFADTLDPNEGAGGGSGTLVEFLAWTGNRINMPVIDETSDTKALQVEWANNRSSALKKVPGEERNAKIDLVLANLAKQTSLQFTRERRTIDVWFVTETPAPLESASAETR